MRVAGGSTAHKRGRARRELIPTGELTDRDDRPVTALRELGTGRTWDIPDTRKEVWLGRRGADIRIPNLSLESAHCALRYNDGRLRVRDLSGKGIRIGHRAVNDGVLRPGDVLSVGDLSLIGMSDEMAGSVSVIEEILGFGLHAEVDRVLAMSRDSTIVVIAPEGGEAQRLPLSAGRWCLDVDEPTFTHGGYARSLPKQTTAVVLRLPSALYRPLRITGLKRRIEQGNLRLVLQARSLDDVERTIGRCPASIPIVHIPTFAQRRADHFTMFERQLQRRGLAVTDLGASNVAALLRYEWAQGPKEIEDAATAIERVFHYGSVASAGGRVGKVPLHPWLNAVGLQLGQSAKVEATERDRRQWAEVMRREIPKRRSESSRSIPKVNRLRRQS